MASTLIRQMREHETEATARMWQESQRAAYPWFREDQRHPFEEALVFFRDSICQRCQVWVAVDDDEQILGMLALEGDLLDHLFIAPASWEQGIGSALLAHAKALRPDGLTLVTLQRNERSRRFYQARGFVTTRLGVSPPPENEPDVYYAWDPAS
jgi:ribosomal protein S18 acetylase RimI-like enzyme